jgi:outer membrane scaffolding protein for murein synthesis (MipA/OmpV family)
VLASLVFIGAPMVSSAADVDFGLGGGVGFSPEYEGSEDYEAVPVPYFSVQLENGRYVRLDGPVLKANLLDNNTWSFGPLLQYRKKRDDDVDNKAVSRMKKIDAALEVGAFLGYKFDSWDFGIQVATDVSGAHDGTLAAARTGYTFKADRMSTRIGASITYANSDYMDTYFSVDAGDSARSGLSRYNADSGIKDIGLDLMLRYSMAENWDIRGALAYIALLNDAKDSPLVDDEGESSQFKGSIIVIYKF